MQLIDLLLTKDFCIICIWWKEIHTAILTVKKCVISTINSAEIMLMCTTVVLLSYFLLLTFNVN